MKLQKIIFALISSVSLVACEPLVTFNEPQPTDTDNLDKFPKRLQGQYSSLTDNSMLSISDKLILRTYDYDYKLHLNQLDGNFRITGDTIVDLMTHEKIAVKRDADSLVRHIHYTDTLFQMDYDNVVKRYKGYYFLNIRCDKASWKVKKVQLTKGQLIVSNIATDQDIKNLQEITESQMDTVPPYKFEPTKRQFKQFLRKNGFSDSEVFVRLEKRML